MSIASELNWTTATKARPGKATEHSGAKKGKGAWDRKKVAKKDSNKGRRAGGKQEIKDQTTSDEADGPFPGAAPLFKKAAAMNWTTAEPRPCYPTEDPVDDHCNEGIAPPAPGGGDDMGSAPPDTGWDEDGDDDFMELGEDPMETAGPASPDPMEAPAPEPAAPQAPQGPGGQQMTGPHDARDPSLAPDAPHQFWSQEAPHVQDALNKYLMPQLNSPDPEIAQKAQRILMEGPHAE